MKWGNPLRIGQWKNYTAANAVRDYQKWLDRDHSVRSFENVYGRPPTREEIVRELRGKNLACWCAIGSPCHGDILLDIANRPICDAIGDSHER